MKKVEVNQDSQSNLEIQEKSTPKAQEGWLFYYQSLEDPRGKQGREHNFLSIVIISVLAVIGGAVGWEDIELYGVSHEEWLRTFLNLEKGIPSADTYRRVLARLKPEALQACFQGWIKQVVEETGGQIIPIDGKEMRGSYDRNHQQGALRIVSAWAMENHLMLGQVKVDSKSNEITAIPILLESLEVKGCTITIDAMGTQKAIAEKIVEKQADYVLSLKRNHPTLHDEVESWFKKAEEQKFQGVNLSHDLGIEAGHNRREKREIWAIPLSEMGGLYQEEEWAGLQTIVRVERYRHLWNKTTHEIQFYLTSLPCSAQVIGRAIRQHWSIENQLHWVLDVTFSEDSSRIRRGHGAENFTFLRRMAIGILNQENSKKRSLRQKSRLASMNSRYMLQVLTQAFFS